MMVCEMSVYALLGVYFLVSMIAMVISIAFYRNNFLAFMGINLFAHILVLANMRLLLAITIDLLC